MTPEQFCYWFQGFSELNEKAPTPEQWKAIKEHLATVFHKVTPPYITTSTPQVTTSWPWAPNENPFKPDKHIAIC